MRLDQKNDTISTGAARYDMPKRSCCCLGIDEISPKWSRMKVVVRTTSCKLHKVALAQIDRARTYRE